MVLRGQGLACAPFDLREQVVVETNRLVVHLHHHCGLVVGERCDPLPQGLKVRYEGVAARGQATQLKQRLVCLSAATNPRLSEGKHVQLLVPTESLVEQIMTT